MTVFDNMAFGLKLEKRSKMKLMNEFKKQQEYFKLEDYFIENLNNYQVDKDKGLLLEEL